MSIVIKRATKSVPLCVNLALAAEHDLALSRLEQARRLHERDPRESDTSVRDAAGEVLRIEDQMAAHTLHFKLQALPKKAWAEFLEANPPRNDIEAQNFGVDVSKLDPMIAASIVEVTDHKGAVVKFDPATEWESLADDMSNAQWEQFGMELLKLNNKQVVAPFSRAASSTMRRFEASSNRLKD